jgi:hypothetical protein
MPQVDSISCSAIDRHKRIKGQGEERKGKTSLRQLCVLQRWRRQNENAEGQEIANRHDQNVLLPHVV